MILSPYIRFAINEYVNYTAYIKERIIFDYELLYIKEGELLITVEDSIYNAKPGDIFLFRPNKRHSLRVLSENGFRQPHLHFDLIYQDDSPQVPISFKNYEDMTVEEHKMIRKDIIPDFNVNLPDKLIISDMNTFEQLLYDVIYEYENKVPFSDLSTQGAFLRLWSFILRQHAWLETPIATPHDSLMMEIRQYLNTNANHSLSLDELAEQYNISKFHLSHTFKKVFGLSPIQYHQLCRLEKAKTMAMYTNFSMTQIADILGFTSLSAFTRAFKKQYDIYPSAFRQDEH